MKTWKKLESSKKDLMAMEVYIKCTAITKGRGLKRKTAYYLRLRTPIITKTITAASCTPQRKIGRNT